MDIKQEESTPCNDRLQKVIQSLSKCKIVSCKASK